MSLTSELTKETFGPLFSRKTEQAFIDTRNALCTNPRFREEIIKFRVSLADVRYDNLCEDVVTHYLCEEWRLSGGEKWIAWLIKNWDPETSQLPPHESCVMSNSFYPWTIKIEYLNSGGQPGVGIGIKATISLNAGVSEKEAVAATKLAIKKLNPDKGRSGRPSISDIDRAELRNIFERQGLPKGRN